MISRAERQHVVTLKKWSVESRAAFRKVNEGPIGKLFAKISEGQNPEVIYDNIDWLIALIERESHTAGVKALLRAGKDCSVVTRKRTTASTSQLTARTAHSPLVAGRATSARHGA